jgi:hypothetical protein
MNEQQPNIFHRSFAKKTEKILVLPARSCGVSHRGGRFGHELDERSDIYSLGAVAY